MKITPQAKVIYFLLVLSAGKNTHCWPSQNYIAEATQICIRTVQRCLKELEEAKLIVMKTSQGFSLTYYILDHPVMQPEQKLAAQINPYPESTDISVDYNSNKNRKYTEQDTPANLAQGGCASTSANLAYIKYIKDKNISPSLPPTQATSEKLSSAQKSAPEGVSESFSFGVQKAEKAKFEALWSAWPKQQSWQKFPENKNHTFRVWQELKQAGSLPDQEVLLERVQCFKAQDAAWKDGHAPALVNWLKGSRWNDAPRLASKDTAHEAAAPAPLTPQEKEKQEHLLRKMRRDVLAPEGKRIPIPTQTEGVSMMDFLARRKGEFSALMRNFTKEKCCYATG